METSVISCCSFPCWSMRELLRVQVVQVLSSVNFPRISLGLTRTIESGSAYDHTNPNPLSQASVQTLLEFQQLQAVPTALGSLFHAHRPVVKNLFPILMANFHFSCFSQHRANKQVGRYSRLHIKSFPSYSAYGERKPAVTNPTLMKESLFVAT